MSKNKVKGTAAETAVVNYLRTNGYPHAERRALAGSVDKGDITGVDPDLAIEVKNCATMTLAGWVDEARDEAFNIAAQAVGVVWHKRKGKGDPGDWYVTMEGDTFLAFLHAWTEGRL